MNNILLTRIAEFEAAGGHLWLDGSLVRYRFPTERWLRMNQIIEFLRRHRNDISQLLAFREHRIPDYLDQFKNWQPSEKEVIQ
jgi:hypothetical protein